MTVILHFLLMMTYQWFLISLFFSLSYSQQQYYDQTLCSSDKNYPGTRYTCNPSSNPCRTFVVYRANNRFATISSISNLFKISPARLLSINNLSNSGQILEPGREVLVPIICSCAGQFSQANSTYTVTESVTLLEAACGVFQGLVKSITLFEENRHLSDENALLPGSTVLVPLKCSCPDNNLTSNASVKYLVTYPFIKGDDTGKLSEKFNVSVEEIWRANGLDPTPTVYPHTTVLVPLKDKPFVNFDSSYSDPPTQFLPTMPLEKKTTNVMKKLFIVGLVLGFFLIVALLVAIGLYIKALKKFKAEKFRFSTHRISSMNSCSTPLSSPFSGSNNSCLSPDLLIGIKYSLCNYTMGEIKNATKNFCENSRISNCVYKGCLIDNSEVMIKRLRSEGTRGIIDVHSKINHVNIVKLNGVCYDEDDFTSSCLVFEFPSNGSLRDCLLGSSSALHWHRRTQIAFDMATGLHYLHYCVIPPYFHLSLSSKSIFLTSTWRAKIAVSGNGDGTEKVVTIKGSGPGGWIAPEHNVHGSVTEKVDIFAFGVVLLELISGKEGVDGKLLSESIKFSGGGANEGGCFDQLRNFMDPCLKGDYPLAEALCLAVLAGSCVEDDPLHRPSMDDVLKIIARMV
ncbi:hypothetical protein BUALT_Bualt02G0043500 [Buddleja alternifolia]|uniref:Uncharacterized protein n=1 Tax=Buddleja alternifolia TaxID=168488 RepID=A0AAV6XX98_9LAMI|nr:hypothetical protein BUALT_Bualt02G0043500 [Buddleja alternifolia]